MHEPGEQAFANPGLHGMGKDTLVSCNIRCMGISREQVMQMGCTAAPVADDEDRRHMDLFFENFGINESFLIPTKGGIDKIQQVRAQGFGIVFGVDIVTPHQGIQDPERESWTGRNKKCMASSKQQCFLVHG